MVAHHLPLSGRGGHHKEVLEVHNVGVPQPPLDVHLPDHVLRVVLVHEHVLNFFDRHKLPSLVVSGKADHAKRALPDGPKELVPLSDLRPTDRNREDDVSWWNRFFFLSRVMARRGRRGMIKNLLSTYHPPRQRHRLPRTGASRRRLRGRPSARQPCRGPPPRIPSSS